LGDTPTAAVRSWARVSATRTVHVSLVGTRPLGQGIAGSPWQRRSTGAGNPRPVVRVSVQGTFYEGVPVPLPTLLHGPDDTWG
jgi:hypothetical protein